jgi:putative ABC transport system substrate-binding protein
MVDASSQGSSVPFAKLEETARKLNFNIQMLDSVGSGALERSFEVIRRERLQGLLVGGNGTLIDGRVKLVQFVSQERLPAVYALDIFVRDGGLLSYAADREHVYARGADFVARILRGAKPTSLPVEQASIFRMMVNLKAARAMGIKIPESIRLRADEIIE